MYTGLLSECMQGCFLASMPRPHAVPASPAPRLLVGVNPTGRFEVTHACHAAPWLCAHDGKGTGLGLDHLWKQAHPGSRGSQAACRCRQRSAPLTSSLARMNRRKHRRRVPAASWHAARLRESAQRTAAKCRPARVRAITPRFGPELPPCPPCGPGFHKEASYKDTSRCSGRRSKEIAAPGQGGIAQHLGALGGAYVSVSNVSPLTRVQLLCYNWTPFTNPSVIEEDKRVS